MIDGIREQGEMGCAANQEKVGEDKGQSETMGGDH